MVMETLIPLWRTEARTKSSSACDETCFSCSFTPISLPCTRTTRDPVAPVRHFLDGCDALPALQHSVWSSTTRGVCTKTHPLLAAHIHPVQDPSRKPESADAPLPGHASYYPHVSTSCAPIYV